MPSKLKTSNRKSKSRKYRGGVEGDEIATSGTVADGVATSLGTVADGVATSDTAASPGNAVSNNGLYTPATRDNFYPGIFDTVPPASDASKLSAVTTPAPPVSTEPEKQPLPTAVEIVGELKKMPKGTFPFQGPALALAGALAPMVDKYKDRIANIAGYENADEAVSSMVQLAMKQAVPAGIDINSLTPEQLDKYTPAITNKLTELEQQFISEGQNGETMTFTDLRTGESYTVTFDDTCPRVGSAAAGGDKKKYRKMKGGWGDKEKIQLIDLYLTYSEALKKGLKDFSIIYKGTQQPYERLDNEGKLFALKEITKTISGFIKLLNKCSEPVKAHLQEKLQPSAGGRKKQRGGADDFIFSKLYNTQGLIMDNNDPIKNAVAYTNTADQIPQPFSSISSGATYSSGIEASFLQDVLPVLNMAGGMKQKLKSKQDRK